MIHYYYYYLFLVVTMPDTHTHCLFQDVVVVFLKIFFCARELSQN